MHEYAEVREGWGQEIIAEENVIRLEEAHSRAGQ